MYTFIREVTFKTVNDTVKAMPLTAEIAGYFKKSHNVDMKLLRPVSGSPSRLRFVMEMDSMDGWQAMWQKALQDPNLHRLLAEIAPFVDGSKTFDEIWR